MLEKHGIACDLMHGFNLDKWTTGKPTERLALKMSPGLAVRSVSAGTSIRTARTGTAMLMTNDER